MAKSTASLEEAAKALIVLLDGDGYSGREYDIVVEAIRAAVRPSSAKYGPIVPDDEGETVDARAVERDRSPKEVIDTIIKVDADATKAADEEHERHLKAKAAWRAEAAKAEKAEAAPAVKAPAKAKAKKAKAPTPVTSGVASTGSTFYSGSGSTGS